MEKTTQNQILTTLLKISKDLTALNQRVQVLRGMSKEQRMPRRENPKTLSKIFLNPKARELTTRLFEEGITYNEIKQRLFSELNFSTSTSSISRFYRHLLKENCQK